MKIMGIVLAAGQGKRMKSKLYKVLHQVCGKPMVGHVTHILNELEASRKVIVVGHGAAAVQSYLGEGVEYALQETQLGTGHAVLQAKPLLEKEEGITIVIAGDTPLIKAETLRSMIHLHQSSGAAASVLTANMDNPHGYGRIVRDEKGEITKIVEQKDCTPQEAELHEINTGTFCFDNQKLFAALAQVTNNNAQNEYYLTDVIGILKQEGQTVIPFCTDDEREAIGVNDRVALAEAGLYMKERINREHMVNGVTLIDPSNTYIESSVKIGQDTVIWPGTVLRGNTVIGSGCEIGPNTEITDCQIGNDTAVKQSVLHQAKVAEHVSIGPFAYLRPGADIGPHVKIGDFVEIKNAVLGEGTKVSHLSYVGDAEIGKNVNIGCGAITANYDGYNKHKTVVEDDAFIGSNVNLIAPVTVGKGAYVVAGSTINLDVPADDMAVARERQTNKPGYAENLRARFKALKNK